MDSTKYSHLVCDQCGQSIEVYTDGSHDFWVSPPAFKFVTTHEHGSIPSVTLVEKSNVGPDK